MRSLKSLCYITLLAFAILPLTFLSCSSDDGEEEGNATSKNENANILTASTPDEILRLEFPKIKGGNNLVIVHSTSKYGVTYSLEWDCSKKSQRWSCYEMYAGNSVANTSRYIAKDGEEQYPQDTSIPKEYRFSQDPFYSSGYDHGHICPSADRLCSSEANKQTFFLSNMQPQVNGFNAGIWEKMEAQVRTWNKSSFRDTLYVCKGGTIDHADQIITTTSKGLIVPKYFFMAILCKNAMGYKALGFWVEHKANNDTGLAKYVVNIDTLEKYTGIDFFCNLPDNIEKSVEGLDVENVKRAWGLQ